MSRGSYARKTEVKRDEHRSSSRLQRWVDRTDRTIPDEYHNKATPALQMSLKQHLANECKRYYEVRGCAAQIVNAINSGAINAPGEVLKRNARQVVAQAIRKGLITQSEG